MRNRAAVCLLALGILLVGVVAADGQTAVLNPRIVEFDPSPDHNTLGPDKVPVVQRYELQFYPLGAAQPLVVSDLGKPAPEADGKIRVDFTSRLASWPPNGDYQARVAAVGPSGAGQSDTSNPFSFQTCSVALGAFSQSLGATGGGGSVAVTTAAGCGWTATSTAAWVGVATTTGSGAGTVSYTVAANTGTTARTATLLIGGVSFTVNQAGAAAVPTCTYTLSPSSVVVGGNGNSGNLTVTCTTGCLWSATKSASWITLNTASGAGSGNVSYSIAKNTTGAVRTGTIVVAGRTCTITQGVPVRPTAPKKPRVTIGG